MEIHDEDFIVRITGLDQVYYRFGYGLTVWWRMEPELSTTMPMETGIFPAGMKRFSAAGLSS